MSILFRDYDRKAAEIMFPTIEVRSPREEIDQVAWQATIDLMKEDRTILAEALIGEYLGSFQDMEDYHIAVLESIADQDYKRAGFQVENAFLQVQYKVVDYIEQYMFDMAEEYYG